MRSLATDPCQLFTFNFSLVNNAWWLNEEKIVHLLCENLSTELWLFTNLFQSIGHSDLLMWIIFFSKLVDPPFWTLRPSFFLVPRPRVTCAACFSSRTTVLSIVFIVWIQLQFALSSHKFKESHSSCLGKFIRKNECKIWRGAKAEETETN